MFNFVFSETNAATGAPKVIKPAAPGFCELTRDCVPQIDPTW
jgi:hypothetical protein